MKTFYKNLLFVAIPVALENLIYATISFVDIFMINSLKNDSITAGIGFSSKITFFFIVSLYGLSSGGGIFSSQFWGKNDVKSMNKVLGITLTISFVFSILFISIGYLNTESILRLFTSEKEIIQRGTNYFQILVWSYLFSGVTMCFTGQLRSISKTIYPMIGSIMALLINTMINYVLIFGKFGFPRLEERGAAIGTVIAVISQCIFLIVIVYKFKLPIAGKIKDIFHFKLKFVKDFMKVSFPVFLHELFWVTGVTVCSAFLGQKFGIKMAAITSIEPIGYMAFIAFIGLSNASAVMIGNKIGESNEETAFQYAKNLIKINLLIAVIVIIILFTMSNIILNAIIKVPETREIARLILYVELILLTPKTLGMLFIVGIFRAGGDTKWSMWVDLILLFGLSVPITYFSTFIIGVPIYLAYALIKVDELVKIPICFRRYLSKKWINNLVENVES